MLILSVDTMHGTSQKVEDYLFQAADRIYRNVLNDPALAEKKLN